MPATDRLGTYAITLPPRQKALGQDEEWCEVVLDGESERLRFHDYDRIFDQPGLYEQLFYDTLKCDSPRVIRDLLSDALVKTGFEPSSIRLLDVGAGNGMVAEEIRDLGASTAVGVDILPEAKDAALRDRPDVYDAYEILDLTALTEEQREGLLAHRLNTMTVVAALGFGDIPCHAFTEALRVIKTPGWLAFNIRDAFVQGTDDSGFARLVRTCFDEGYLKPVAQRTYTHRLAASGKPLEYVAFVAEKTAEIPERLVAEAEGWHEA